MRDTVDRVALRYLTAVLLGLVLLLLHGVVQSGPLTVLVPQRASPWELSKMVFWPMLGACLMTCRLGRAPAPLTRGPAGGGAGGSGSRGGELGRCWRPAAAAACSWQYGAWLWRAGLAFGPDGTRRPRIWLGLCGMLAAGYILLTVLPLA